MGTLVFIEDPADELSQQAVVMARRLGDDEIAPVLIDPAGGYAPAAWAQTLVEIAQARGATAVTAPGSERGNEVLAHVAAKLEQPMAANCVSVTPGDPAIVTRVRWGGSLLEEAHVHGAPLLFTSAAHAVAAAPIADVDELALVAAGPPITDGTGLTRLGPLPPLRMDPTTGPVLDRYRELALQRYGQCVTAAESVWETWT